MSVAWSPGDKCSFYSEGEYHSAILVSIEVGKERPFLLFEDGALLRSKAIY